MGGWFWLHIITQVLAVLAAAGGITIAILAFGWKDVPGLTLYQPHKWIGVGVMGMALLQLLVAPLRPAVGTKPRGCWNILHWNWGRLTVLAGCGNTIIGALLYHDYKDEPYINWLLPCCVLIGLMGLLALALEAFKMQVRPHSNTSVCSVARMAQQMVVAQLGPPGHAHHYIFKQTGCILRKRMSACLDLQMQRTHRYNHKTQEMRGVLDGHKRSKRRSVSGQSDVEDGSYPTITHYAGDEPAPVKAA